MLEINKYSITGEELGKVTLPETLFAVECNNPKAVLYEVIKMYLANQRQGTSAAKGRSDVKGSGKKLFRQKGTGNARPGNVRTPVRVGGGVAFGPTPKNWVRNIPKKKKRLALKLALTQRANEKQVIVVESMNFDKPSTKKALDFIEKVAPSKSRKLVIIDGSDRNIIKSFSNIPYLEMDRADSVYAYEVMKSNFLIITEDALNKMQEVFAK